MTSSSCSISFCSSRGVPSLVYISAIVSNSRSFSWTIRMDCVVLRLAYHRVAKGVIETAKVAAINIHILYLSIDKNLGPRLRLESFRCAKGVFLLLSSLGLWRNPGCHFEVLFERCCCFVCCGPLSALCSALKAMRFFELLQLRCLVLRIFERQHFLHLLFDLSKLVSRKCLR